MIIRDKWINENNPHVASYFYSFRSDDNSDMFFNDVDDFIFNENVILSIWL